MAMAKASKKVSIKKSTPAAESWELRLYIAGNTPKSMAALENLKRYCEQHLRGKYSLEVVDLLVQPWRVTLVSQFVNSLRRDNTVKPTDMVRPVLGFEACEHESGCGEGHETFPSQS